MILALDVTTTTGCPDPVEVVAMARSKAPPGWDVVTEARDADARASIRLDPPGEGRPAAGHLTGSLGSRDLEGSSCATVAEALAFAVALRLPDRLEPPRVGPPRVSPPVARPTPIARPPAEPIDPTRPHPLVEIGAETQFAWGLAPSHWAGGLFTGVHLRGLGLFTPGLRATFLHGFPGRPDPEANAVFERYALRLDTCPIGGDTWRLHISGCVGVGIEALALQTGESTIVEVVRGGDIAEEPAPLRMNVLAAARTDVRVVDPLRLELTLGLVLNPGVEGFSFDEHGQAFESAPLAPFVGLGLGVSIE